MIPVQHAGRAWVDLTELSTSGAIPWEKEPWASYQEPVSGPNVPYQGPVDFTGKYGTGLWGKQFHYTVDPNMPSDWPFNPEEPYGQLRKTPYEKPRRFPAKELPPEADWKDGVAAYKRGRAPGRLWGPSAGIGVPPAQSKKIDARPFWRRPRDTAVDGPRPDPNLRGPNQQQQVFFSLDRVLDLGRRLRFLAEAFTKGGHDAARPL